MISLPAVITRWAVLFLSFTLPVFAQRDAAHHEAQKKSSAIKGAVEQVDPAAKQLRMRNDPVPGGMAAMSMLYSVDDEHLLHTLKPGDRIAATVVEGETLLHDVHVIPAEDAAALSLADLERMALANNPTVAQAGANLRASNSLARQAGLYPNPTVGYYGDEIRGGYYSGGKQGGFISQTIVTGGKLRAARRVAELRAGESKTMGEAQRLRIANNVRMSFYEVLAAQRMVEVRRNLQKLAADATQTAHQLANIGQADRPDVLQAEVEQQQAIVGLRVAEQNLRSSWRTLAAVVGKPGLALTPLTGDFDAIPELDYDQWLAATLRESPEIKLAQQAIERAEASVTQAKKAPIPDLQLYGNLTQNFEPLETTGKATGLNGGVQIGVQLPIFNHNQGAIAAAKDEVESAKQELARLKLQIARDLAGLFREYESSRATVQQYKTEMLPRAEQAYQLYRSSYQNMAAAYPQALFSQRTLFQLEADYVQALEKAWRSSLGIRGFGLMDGLLAPAMMGGAGMSQ